MKMPNPWIEITFPYIVLKVFTDPHFMKTGVVTFGTYTKCAAEAQVM